MIRTSLLLCGILGASACLPPESTYDDERHVTVDWSLKGPGGASASCPSGYDTVLVEACLEEELYSCFTQTTECDSTGSQSVTVYTTGRYRPDADSSFWDLSSQFWVYLSLTDATGETRYVSSVAEKVDLASGDKSVDAELYPEAGFLRLAWTPTSAASGSSASTCGELDVDEIELAYAKYTSSTPALDQHVRWPCTNQATNDPDASYVGDGDTPALAPGSYIGDVIAYRAGVEIGRYTGLTFSIEDRGTLTESSAYVEITDR